METELADGGTSVDEAGSDAELSPAPDPMAPTELTEVDSGASSDLSIDEVDRLLDEVEGALSRLDDGTYGTCAACGGPIEDVLLAGSPTTRTCQACAASSVAPPSEATGSDS